MNNFATGWLASEDAAQDVIHLKRIYIKINDGNLYDGVMFSQIMFWHGRNKETGKPRMKIKKQGYLWLAKKYSDWEDECGINEYTAKKCINRIKERGLIIVNLWKFDNVPMLHIRINWDEFEKRIMSNRPERSNPLDTRGLINQTLEVDSITETTSKNTTERDIAPIGAPPPPPMTTTNGNHALNGHSGKSHPPSSDAPPSIQKDLDTAVSEMLEAWGRLFPNKPQPRSATYRSKIKTLLKVSQFREHWLEAMEWASESPSCQSESWFHFGFFVQQSKGEYGWEKCLRRWMDWKDKKIKVNGNGCTDDIEREWQSIKLAAAQPGRPDISERALRAIQLHVPGGWHTFKQQNVNFFDQLKPIFKEAYERVATNQPATT